MADIPALRQRWLQLWSRIGATPPHAHECFGAVCQRYGEPHRAYHTLDHIADCLKEFDEVSDLAQHPEAVELALWYHDTVYEPRAGDGDNERRSAELAACHLLPVTHLTLEFVTRVHLSILATAHKRPPYDPDAQLVVDIDLASLGYAQEIFDQNNAHIRTEYSFVPDALFNARRAEILRGFLPPARPRIYYTDYFYRKYEESARANLQRCLNPMHGV